MPMTPAFLSLLVCPVTKGPLHYSADTQELISPSAGLVYPIRDSVPILVLEEARPLEGSSTERTPKSQ